MGAPKATLTSIAAEEKRQMKVSPYTAVGIYWEGLDELVSLSLSEKFDTNINQQMNGLTFSINPLENNI